jgi:hypothetical protein
MEWFVHPQIPVAQPSDSFLWNDLLHFLQSHFNDLPILYPIITYLFLFTQAISFNQLIIRRKLMRKPNYLPAMSFLLITSFFAEWNTLSSGLVVSTLLIWVIAKMFTLNNAQHAKSSLFNIGLIIGICSIFQFYFIALGLLIFLSLMLLRPFRIAEWLMVLVGILITWYFLLSLLFLNNEIYSFHLPQWQFSIPSATQYFDEYVLFILVIVLTLLGGFLVQSESSKQVVQVRKNWTLLFYFFLIALLIPAISNSHHFHYWLLIALPSSAFIGALFFYTPKKWAAQLLHWFLVVCVIYMQYFTELLG